MMLSLYLPYIYDITMIPQPQWFPTVRQTSLLYTCGLGLWCVIYESVLPCEPDKFMLWSPVG